MSKYTAQQVIQELGPKFMEFLEQNQLSEFITDFNTPIENNTVIGIIFEIAYSNGIHSSQFLERSKRIVELMGGFIDSDIVEQILSRALGYRNLAQMYTRSIKLKFKAKTYYYPSAWRHGLNGHKQIFQPDEINPLDVKIRKDNFWEEFKNRNPEEKPDVFYTPVDYMQKVAFYYTQSRKTLKECARDMQILSSGQLTLGDSYRMLAKAMGYESWYHAKVSSAPDEPIQNAIKQPQSVDYA